MLKAVRKEVEKLIKELELDCSVEEFKFKADWYFICIHKKISENFMREFRERIYWDYIPDYQQPFSEEFKNEFEDRVGCWNDCENCEDGNDCDKNDYDASSNSEEEALRRIKSQLKGRVERFDRINLRSFLLPSDLSNDFKKKLFKDNKNRDDKNKNDKIMEVYNFVIRIFRCFLKKL